MTTTVRRLMWGAAAAALMTGATGVAMAQEAAVGTAPAEAVSGPVDPRDQRLVELQMQLSSLAEEVRALRETRTADMQKVEAMGASIPKVAWKGGPEFSGPGGATFKVRGRVLVDGVFQNWEPNNPAVADLDSREFRGRQVFLGVEGKLNDRFAYKVEGGWVNGGSPVWDDAVLEFKPTKTSSILFGNAKAAGLENITSTRFLTFMERGPYANVAGLDYNLGVVARTWGKNWSITGAVQGESLNNADVLGEEQLSEVARVTFAPILSKTTTAHLGLWARHRDRGTGAGFNYAPRPSTAYIPGGAYALKSTGAVGDSDNTIGAEAMLIHGPFSVQGEYVHIDYDAITPGADGDVNAGYIQGTWFLGGNRTYTVATGDVGRPKIDKALNDGGWGALELAARYDFADINNSPLAGDYTGFTLGANYYATPYVRFMLNYVDGSQDNPVATDGIDVQVLQMRAQLDF
jgi:phosphate-selective porin OprO and OprP